MRATQAAAILSEDRQSSLRVLAEAHAKPCEHKTTTVVDHAGGGLDDHATAWLKCLRCGEGIVATAWLSRADVEVRPMTDREKLRYGIR